MGRGSENNWDGQYSEIGDKPELEFLDYDDDESLHNYDSNESGPVEVTTPFPFRNGKPQSGLVGQTSASPIQITNNTSEPVQLWSVKIFASNPEDCYILSLMQPPKNDDDEHAVSSFLGSTSLEDRFIQPGESLTIWLSCKPGVIGLHSTIVHFDIDDERIERAAFLIAEDEISQALFSNKTYSRRSSQVREVNCANYVPGSRPTRQGTHCIRYVLPKYDIPRDVREIIKSKQIPDVIMEGLNIENYVQFFTNLIYLEEIHMEEEMSKHGMQCVTMKRKGNNFLSLEVPGLAERRPSLVCGDFIFAQLSSDNADNQNDVFQGYIHRVEADEIYLRFDKDFHQRHRADNLYDVRFTYNRVNMRRLYAAVHAAEKLVKDFLFPSQSAHRRVIKPLSFVPLNPNLNQEQTRSVEKILGCKGGPPFVVHGPPGTGKTMTFVEAILQVCKASKKARVLVCASSNSASDHVLEKLLENQEAFVKANEIFRLNATSRQYDDVKPELMPFCYFDELVFKCPPFRALLRYRIIISTYMSSSLLHSEGIKRGHFTHIFLDEAGQASEPETMVPISNFYIKNTVVVLAGDPMQLGPVIYSRMAETYDLGKSFLDRLFECKQYETGDDNYVIKLVRNYRSHPAILELPSNLFYNGELIACKGDDRTPIYECIDLPNKAFPVLFAGIQGCDEREGNNPSWFNRIEASKVVEIIRRLVRSTDLSDADIGVITPYRQQVLKLKKALESLSMPDLKVGSVEQFQGQEREVIIISTVRSTVKHNEFDKVHNLGFLTSPKRFNVAITRARSLLIIVGNPHIICKDRHWDKLLRYCADNGSYQGCSLPPPEIQFYPGEESSDYDAGHETTKPYFKDEKWSEDYSKLDVDAPKQRAVKSEWDSILSTQHGSNSEAGPAGGNGFSNTCDDQVKWTDYAEYESTVDECKQYYKDDGQWNENEPIQYLEKQESDVTQGQNQVGTDLNYDASRPYSKGIQWGDIIIQPTGWGSDDSDQELAEQNKHVS